MLSIAVPDSPTLMCSVSYSDHFTIRRFQSLPVSAC